LSAAALHLLRLAALLLLFATIPAPAAGEDFPRRAVHIIVPFSAGLGPDVVMRTLAEQLSLIWKQPVLVENHPGASGLIALLEAKKANADGHVIVLAEAGAMSVMPAITPDMTVAPLIDFVPVTTIFRAHFLLLVGAASPYATLKDLLLAAKASPGKVSYASFGNGHASQIAIETLAQREGLDLLHVPYRDGGQLMGDLTRADVGFTALSSLSAAGMLKDGRVRALAVGTRVRLKEFPEVPTIAEAGGPAMEMSPWAAIFAPAGTPAPVLDKLQQDIRAALASPEVRSRVESMGFDVLGSTPKELAELVRRETGQNAALVKSGRIRRGQ
jgi:tripartite-type tricarboxylate transporter receptor subunit TctC